jgi:hypothetical protein
MSAPHPAPQRETPGRLSGKLDRNHVLLLVAAIAGPLAYLVGITNHALSGLAGFALVTAGALAGLRFLPKAPDTTFAAAPLAGYAVLALVRHLVNGGGGLAYLLLVLAVLQTAALVVLLLVEAGVVNLPGGRSQPPQPRQTASPAPPPAAPYGRPGPLGQAPPWQQPPADAPGFGGRWQPAPAGGRGPGAPEPPAGAPREEQRPENPPTPESGPQGTRQMPHPNRNQ